MDNINRLLEAYADNRLGREYGFRDPAYTQGYHRGQDVRKQNAKKTASVVTDTIAIHDGTVVYIGRPNKSLELTIVIDTGMTRGRYESHSHQADFVVKQGQKVKAGQKLARNAAMNENPGLISGPHDHITMTNYKDGAWITTRPSYDPLPFIRAAVARAKAQVAAEQVKPLPTPAKPEPTPVEEEEDMPKNSAITYVERDTKKVIHVVFNTGSGFVEQFGSGSTHPMSDEYLAGVAKAYDVPHGFQTLTEAHAEVIKKALLAVRTKTR